jgi:uncharacterized protein YjbI with pentapeptide repeats
MPRRARAAIAPDLPALPEDLEPTDLQLSAVESGSDWSRLHLADAALAGLAAPGVGFEESRLERVDLSGSRLANLSLTDSELHACNLANVDARADRCAARSSRAAA